MNENCNHHYATPSAMPRPLHVPVTPPWYALALIHILKKNKNFQNIFDQVITKICGGSTVINVS